jgi:hypothetical protein
MRMFVDKSMYYGLPLQPITSLADKDAEMSTRGYSRDERVLHGPILGDGNRRVTYQSHTITIVAYTPGSTVRGARTARVLHMRHGGGEEVFEIYPGGMNDVLLPIVLALDDVTAYCYFYQLYRATTDSYNAGRDWEHAAMLRAAAEGRIQVRKVRNHDAHRVTVTPPSTAPSLLAQP